MSYETKPDEGRYNRKIRFALLNRNVSFAEAVDLIFHLHDAATRGAPQAIQVADRFHLLKNLREKLADVLKRKHPCLPEVEEARADGIPKTAQGQVHAGSARSAPPCPKSPPEATLPSTLPRGSPSFPANERRKQERRTSRYARYEEVLALHRQGRSEREIAQTLGVCRNTVHRFLTAEGYPELSDWPKRGSLLDPYNPYLLERVQHGCWQGEQLYQEIKERGYGGSESLLRLFLADLRRRQRGTPASPMQSAENDTRLASAGAIPPKQPRHRRLSASRASWLFVRPPEHLDELQRRQLDQIRLAHPDLETAYQLSQCFVSIVTHRQHTEVDSWLTRAAHCGLPEFRGFARSLRQDYAAVCAACSLPWSQGQVEGQVNRLKLQKRLMFGRGHFDLLRQRVLHRA